MKKIYGNVALVTGASSGIGLAVVELLMENGYRVYGTYRSSKNWTNREKGDGFVKMVGLDVCSTESVRKCVDYVVEQEGHIDILVNNAGFGIAGPIEDFTDDEVQSQFDTNFFGVHRMCRQVLPVMRKQQKGLIINTGSVGGLTGLPFQSVYCTSKFALDGLTQCLRIEAAPFGIKVVTVEPGEIKTGFTKNRRTVRNLTDAYNLKFQRSLAIMEKNENNGSSPEKVARTVLRLTRKKNPPARTATPFVYKLLAFGIKILPCRLTEFMVKKMY